MSLPAGPMERNGTAVVACSVDKLQDTCCPREGRNECIKSTYSAFDTRRVVRRFCLNHFNLATVVVRHAVRIQPFPSSSNSLSTKMSEAAAVAAVGMEKFESPAAKSRPNITLDFTPSEKWEISSTVYGQENEHKTVYLAPQHEEINGPEFGSTHGWALSLMHFKGLPPEWMPLSDHFMNHKSLFFIARKNVLLPAMSKNPRCLRLYGRRQRDSARGRGLTQEKLTPFLLLARIPSLSFVRSNLMRPKNGRISGHKMYSYARRPTDMVYWMGSEKGW